MRHGRKLGVEAKTETTFLQLLVSHGVDGQFVVDSETDRILEVNPALSELSGFSREELLGPDFQLSSMVLRDHRELYAQLIEEAVEYAPQEIRVPVATHGGDERWFDFRFRVFIHDSKRLMVGSARDMTDQVKHEQRLANLLEVGEKEHRRRTRNTAKIMSSTDMNSRLLQTIQSLRGVPELSKQISQVDRAEDVLKEACLYLTDAEKGLNFGSAAIYLKRGDAMEMAYAAPLRVTRRIREAGTDIIFKPLIEGSEMVMREKSDNRLVPIRSRDQLIGVLEVGVGRHMSRIFSVDDPVREAQESVIKSIADVIGSHLANLELRDEIKMQVIRDKLTGLCNRRHFDEQLVTEFKRALRYERALSLLCIDIDHFKKMNDTHGHPQGDIALQTVANVLAKSFRDLDTVCRTGGEEMAVIMPETLLPDAVAKADRVRQAIEDATFQLSRSNHPEERDKFANVTVSIGAAAINSMIEDQSQLYDLADKALYRAKNSGRNRVMAAEESDFE